MHSPAPGNVEARRAAWIALLAAATVAGSLVFACAAPFAALAAIAALHMGRRDAFTLAGLAWGINQAIGFGFLGYPLTWETVGWGLAIGVGALVATAVAIEAVVLARAAGRIASTAAAFVAAFASYQLALYAATAVLPAGSGFDMDVVLYVAQVNVAGFAGLLIVRELGRMAGFASTRSGAAA